MNDRFDDRRRRRVDSRRPDRRRSAPSIAEPHDRVDRRARRLRAARVHPDAHSSLPDAVSRLRRRSAADGLAAAARLADGSRAHAGDAARGGAARDDRAARERHDRRADDGDGARHRCGVRSRRRKRPARDDRQVHDGRGRRRARAAAGTDARVDRRERGDPQALARRGQRPPARRVRAAVRRVVLARAARGGREPVRRAARARAHARVGIARRDRDRPADLRRHDEPRVPRRRCAWRRRTCAPRTASGSTNASRRCWPSTTSR